MGEVEAYSRLAGVYDELVVDPCFPLWAGFLDALWDADPEGVRTVLDVACGTGLMAAKLGNRGYDVVGIDASEPMLARARMLLGPDADLRLALLPELPVVGPFDAAISTFDGLNYLDLPGFRATLEAVAGVLRPGGWLVFDLHTDAMLQVTIDNPVIEGEEAGRAFVITSVVDPVARVCDARIDVADDAGPFSEMHRQYFHSEEQVRPALASAGLEVLWVADEYTDRAADDATLRATWVCRAPVQGS